MRCSRKYALPMMALAVNIASVAAHAQMSAYSNVGRSPTQQEIQAADISISIDGKGLPPGRGSAKEGGQVYAKKCVGCHGPDLQGVPFPGEPGVFLGLPLVGNKDTLTTQHPSKTIGAYWPYATSVWDYIRRAMPRSQERSLSADEVYALTAFLLYKNDIIKENDVMDAKSLPQVQMPNRNGFLPARIEDIPDLQKRGCRLGHCPENSTSRSSR